MRIEKAMRGRFVRAVRVACAAWVLSLIAGCSGEPSGTSKGGNGAGCSGVEPSKGMSEACCLDYGIDACGANLVCAALDGRTVATCYLEGTRKGLESCTADALCASGECNKTAGKCKSLASEACDVAIGCVLPPGNAGQAKCAAVTSKDGVDTTKLQCLVSTGMETCRFCSTNAECDGGYVCLGGRCVGNHGAMNIPMDCCGYGVAACGASGNGPIRCTCE